MKVPVPALGLATFGLTVDVLGLSIASCFAQNSADPGTETWLDPWHIEYQHPVGFGELQSPADELKTPLPLLKELQKLLGLTELAG